MPPTVALDGECAPGVSDLPRHRVPVFATGDRDVPRAAQFAELARCVQVGNGITAAAAFQVEPEQLPVVLTVEVVGSSEGTLPAAVTLLDHDGGVLAQHDFSEFVQRGGNYSLRFHITSAQADLLLIAPDPGHVGLVRRITGGRYAPVMILTPGGVAAIANGVEDRRELPLDAAGALRVYAHPYLREATDPR